MFIFSKSRLKLVWIGISIWITILILINVTTYFRAGDTPLFLLEKGSLRFDRLWSTLFYFHIVSSCVCLGLGPLLMIPALIRFKRLHKVLGYSYINAVLWIAAPTGILISFTAKGGWPAALGFLITGVAWWISTWRGYKAIIRNELRLHICSMVRSYSIALSAVWFRLIQYALALTEIDYTLNYILSVWLSFAVSVWVSETCIAREFPSESTQLRLPILFQHHSKRRMA